MERARNPGGIAQPTQRVLALERKRDRVMWRAYTNGDTTVAGLAAAIGVEVGRAQSLLVKASAGEHVDAQGKAPPKQTAAARGA